MLSDFAPDSVAVVLAVAAAAVEGLEERDIHSMFWQILVFEWQRGL